MARAQVGIRELKNDLSRWVARADRGAPVARLLPVPGCDPLEALIAAGLVERARRPARSLRPRPRVAEYVGRQRR